MTRKKLLMVASPIACTIAGAVGWATAAEPPPCSGTATHSEVAMIDTNALVGLREQAVCELLGPPAEVEGEGVWRYDLPLSALRLTFDGRSVVAVRQG